MTCPEHGPMMSVEYPEVYDGTSLWVCNTCQAWAHRWPEGHPRRAKVEIILRNAAPLMAEKGSR